ncbi:MAG: hypothetical protein JNK85_06950 [Verrucomicrobiales bacterium]|nr:hypothetical protein [Verrucomicrobiales bacterium]
MTPPAADTPALHQGQLDRASLEQYLADLAACADLLEILPKFNAQTRVDAGVHWCLDDAGVALRNQSVRAIQFRYRFQGSDWWDTVQVRDSSWTVVRIEHRWDRGG